MSNLTTFADRRTLSKLAEENATALAAKADIDSPTFTGVPAAPTAAPGTSTTQIATTEFVTTAITAGAYTNEMAQDAIGAMVNSTLVYNDATPSLGRAALTGDITASAGSNATTLATVNASVGSFGSATQVATFTVNGKGLITAAANTTVTPAVGSITGLGTGVGTALGVNVGAAGAFVTFNGALGTPSSGTLTNATGLPLTSGVSGILPGANGGTNNAFMAFSGPATSLKTFTLPNATGTIPLIGQAQTWTAKQTIAVGSAVGIDLCTNDSYLDVRVMRNSNAGSPGLFVGFGGQGDTSIYAGAALKGVFSSTGFAVTGQATATTWLKSGSYTVATVPSAATAGAGAQIYVSNETGGAIPAFSDATNWRRVTDRAVVS